MSKGKIILGVLAGIAAGAGLGILLSPDKGSKTIKKMTDKIKNATGRFESAIDNATDLAEKGKAKDENSKFKNADHHASHLSKS